MAKAADGTDERNRDQFVVAHAHFNSGENPKVIVRKIAQDSGVEFHSWDAGLVFGSDRGGGERRQINVKRGLEKFRKECLRRR